LIFFSLNYQKARTEKTPQKRWQQLHHEEHQHKSVQQEAQEDEIPEVAARK